MAFEQTLAREFVVQNLSIIVGLSLSTAHYRRLAEQTRSLKEKDIFNMGQASWPKDWYRAIQEKWNLFFAIL